MKNILYSLTLLLVTIGLMNCKKSTTEPTPTKKAFTVQCADTLYFDNHESIVMPVSITSTSGDFQVNIQDISSGDFVMIKNDVTIPAKESRDLEINFAPLNLQPGTHTCRLRSVDYNDGTNVQYKTIYLVVRPTCAYDFRNFTNGKITYYINGTPNYVSVTCKYDSDNTLRITNLSPWIMNLVMDCSNQTCSIKPVTVNGWLKGGTGTFTSSKIQFSISDNGTNIADCEIIP